MISKVKLSWNIIDYILDIIKCALLWQSVSLLHLIYNLKALASFYNGLFGCIQFIVIYKDLATFYKGLSNLWRFTQIY